MTPRARRSQPRQRGAREPEGATRAPLLLRQHEERAAQRRRRGRAHVARRAEAGRDRARGGFCILGQSPWCLRPRASPTPRRSPRPPRTVAALYVRLGLRRSASEASRATFLRFFDSAAIASATAALSSSAAASFLDSSSSATAALSALADFGLSLCVDGVALAKMRRNDST